MAAWQKPGGHWQQKLLGPPGWVSEHNRPFLGPAGEHSLLSNEAMGTPWRLLMQKVHLTLIQPALLEVVVRHGRRALLTVGREQGQVGQTGDPRAVCLQLLRPRDTHIWTDGRRSAGMEHSGRGSKTASCKLGDSGLEKYLLE